MSKKLTETQVVILKALANGGEIRYVVGLPHHLYNSRNDQIGTVKRATVRALELGYYITHDWGSRLGPQLWHITDKGRAALKEQE